MKLPKYTIGIGDRFGRQGKAQLQAFLDARAAGVDVTPVWNKSNREHSLIGTRPADTRAEADAAVQALSWTGAYFVDADHINLKTVDPFIDHSDFFTLDVADYIGQPPSAASLQSFKATNEKYLGALSIPGIAEPLRITAATLEQAAGKFLFAVEEAAKIFRHISRRKPVDRLVIEVSMDEAQQAQTPAELFFILSAVSAAGIPAQTIAPKFTGRFNKGVDYVGDWKQFEKEFEQDLCVIRFAIKEFSLPENLKLSVHSGSDKFSLYPIIGRALRKHDAGLHLKTAGTTWLEELIGLAEAGGSGLAIAQEVYRSSMRRFDEVCAPYATVIDIDKDKLPAPETVSRW
ncbi:MAG TPA: tagaturonate epimerase family protein, partial [bacterium]|nr:tagaturonate epimerase family protein [bacterium]